MIYEAFATISLSLLYGDRCCSDPARLGADFLKKAVYESSQPVPLERRVVALFDEFGTRGGVREQTEPCLGAADVACQDQ